MERVIISGGSGMIGKSLVQKLKKDFQVISLTRQRDLADESDEFIFWNPDKAIIDPEFFGADHVVNLAGANIAGSRWTTARKKLILSSRIKSTEFLIKSIKREKKKIKTFISASAVGIYGDSGDKVMYESDEPIKKDFLSEVCEKWESAAKKAEDVAKTMVILRFGTVLSKTGGALPLMSQPIKFGVANTFGSGSQYISWIHIDDLCNMIDYLITSKTKSETYNAVAPNPHTNKEFIRILKKVINPYAITIPVPNVALKLTLGEMSAVVLNSSRIAADKILASGFEFNYPTLQEALDQIHN